MKRLGSAAGFALAAGILLLVACTSPDRPAAWPESREGTIARAWVEAFSAGEPAMRRFWSENLAASSLAAKSDEERLASYRALRERLGSLRLLAVIDAATANELTVRIADAHGGESEFTFRLEAAEPRKLTAVVARLTESHGFGLFHHGG